MSVSGAQMLDALAPVVRGASRAVLGRGEVASASFGDLLERERSAVRIAPGLDLELSDDQMRRLAEAADRAQRAGARSALVMIDGLALRLDVQSRTVTARESVAAGDVLTGIDALVDASDPAGDPVASLLSGSVHPSIVRALAGAA